MICVCSHFVYTTMISMGSNVTKLMSILCLGPVWPDWVIYWTLGIFLSLILPKSPTFLGNFCKVVKIYHFSSEIIFGQLLQTFGDFFWSHWLGPTNLNWYFHGSKARFISPQLPPPVSGKSRSLYHPISTTWIFGIEFVMPWKKIRNVN